MPKARRRGMNEGTIFERKDGRWVGVLSLGWKNGKRVRKSFYGASAAAVQDKIAEAKNELRLGLPIAVDRQLLGDFLATWLAESVKPRVRPMTHQQYVDHVRLYLAPKLPGPPEHYAGAPSLGIIELSKLRPEHVQAFINAQLKKGLSPRTVQLSLVILRMALGQAVKWGQVARNVAGLVDSPRVERAKIAPLTPEDAKRFLDACKGERFETLYVVALSLGLREGEALGVRWRDIDFANRTLTVAQILTRVGAKRYGTTGEFRFSEPKTDRSRRTVALPDAVVQSLRLHKARQATDQLAAGRAWGNLDLVFTTHKGTPLGARDVVLDFKRVLVKAKLPVTIRFHDLRHSAASLHLAMGTPMRVVMELLGHSTMQLTSDTYSHVFDSLTRDAADKMDAMLTR